MGVTWLNMKMDSFRRTKMIQLNHRDLSHKHAFTFVRACEQCVCTSCTLWVWYSVYTNRRPAITVHQTRSQQSSPGQLPPRNNESEQRFSEICTARVALPALRWRRIAAMMKYCDCVSQYAVNLVS